MAKNNDFEYSMNTNGKSIKITKYVGNGKKVKIPSDIDGLSVNGIEKAAFKDNKDITDVFISNAIKKVPNELFKDCGKLKTVYIEEGITQIGSKAFYNCSKLNEIQIPDSVVDFGNDIFKCVSKPNFFVADSGIALNAIKGVLGSKAEEYARNNFIPFVDENASEEEQNEMRKIAFHYIDGGISLDRWPVKEGCLTIPNEINGTPVIEVSTHFDLINFSKACGELMYIYDKKDVDVIIPENLKAFKRFCVGPTGFRGSYKSFQVAAGNQYLYAEGDELISYKFKRIKKLLESKSIKDITLEKFSLSNQWRICADLKYDDYNIKCIIKPTVNNETGIIENIDYSKMEFWIEFPKKTGIEKSKLIPDWEILSELEKLL